MSDPNEETRQVHGYIDAAFGERRKKGPPVAFGAALCAQLHENRNLFGPKGGLLEFKAGDSVLLHCWGYTDDDALPRAFLARQAALSGLITGSSSMTLHCGGLDARLRNYREGNGRKSDGGEFIGGGYLGEVLELIDLGYIRLDTTKGVRGKGDPAKARKKAERLRDMAPEMPEHYDWRGDPQPFGQSFIAGYGVSLT